jgi:CubicO group peptidase (beta-lactamase class C family)
MNKLLTLALTALLSTAATASDDLSNELKLVEAWLAAQRAYDNVPGLSAAILHDQEVTWSGGFGLADIENERPARADTIYGICSISKLFTGIAVMQLRDRGAYRLDDPIDSLLPWFDLEQAHDDSPEITLRSVLTHSAGLPRESDYPYWMGPDFEFPSREAIREKLGEQATLYPAERYYQYSNLGLTLAGEIVVEQSGQDFETYVREHILQPLDLSDTDTGFPSDAREPRIATGYSYPGRRQILEPLPRYDARGITPAAGFASTAVDLAKFAAWQFRTLDGTDNAVLGSNTLREMQRVQWLDWDWGVARGLAFGVYRVGGRTLTGHAGDCPGFNTRLFLDPVTKTAVAILANRNRTDVDGYAKAIYEILDGEGTAVEPAQADNLNDYTGSYDLSPWDGEDLVFRWKDGLAVMSLPTLDPVGSLTELKHIEGDRFHAVRKDGKPGHEIRFVRHTDGRVTHLNVHSLNLPRLP